jgi:hypothetical protein
MNGMKIEGCAIPPIRPEKGESMGHGASAVGSDDVLDRILHWVLPLLQATGHRWVSWGSSVIEHREE